MINKLKTRCHQAIYSGTFDPITLGHVDIIQRATSICDDLIVAIAQNKKKQPFFSLEERIDIAKEALAHLPQVKVMGFEGLLVDFARQKKISLLIRGLRAVSDFDYEFQMAYMNKDMAPGIETIFLMPSERYSYFSSTLVREILLANGDASPFVPKAVLEAWKKKKGLIG